MRPGLEGPPHGARDGEATGPCGSRWRRRRPALWAAAGAAASRVPAGWLVAAVPALGAGGVTAAARQDRLACDPRPDEPPGRARLPQRARPLSGRERPPARAWRSAARDASAAHLQLLSVTRRVVVIPTGPRDGQTQHREHCHDARNYSTMVAMMNPRFTPSLVSTFYAVRIVRTSPRTTFRGRLESLAMRCGSQRRTTGPLVPQSEHPLSLGQAVGGRVTQTTSSQKR